MSADGGRGTSGDGGRPLPRPPSTSVAASRRESWGLQRPLSNQALGLDDEQGLGLHARTDSADSAMTVGLGLPPNSSGGRDSAPTSPARRHREASLAALTGGGPRLSLNTSPTQVSFHQRKASIDSFRSRQSSSASHAFALGSGVGVALGALGSPPRRVVELASPGASPSRLEPAFDDLPTPRRPQRPIRTSTGLSSVASTSGATSSADHTSSTRTQHALRLPVSPAEDTPQTRAQVHSLNRRLHDLRPHVKATRQAAEDVVRLLDSLAEAERRLSYEMALLGDLLEDGVVPHEGGIRRLWTEDGVVGRQLRERREERESLESSVVEPLQAWGDALKEAERDRLGKKGAGFEDEIKSFQHYTQKYLSAPNSRDTPKLDAAYEKRQRDSDILRFQIQSHLLDLTYGPRFTSLYANLLTFPSLLLNQQSVSPSPALRLDLESSLQAANDLSSAVQDWPFHRMRHERGIMEASALQTNGSAVSEEDWESVEGGVAGLSLSSDGHPVINGGERKRDRLGSKLRAAVGNLTGSRSPGASSPTTLPPSFFPPTSSVLPAPPRSSMSRDEKRRERHSLQVMPKSSSAWGLSASAAKPAGGSATKGIRDLDPTWLALKESEGRKKAGWLWCGGDSKKGGSWDHCWCEVKHSNLVEHRPITDGGEPAEHRTDLMFASAREMRKSDRRFVFEVITSKSTRRYQATSDLEMNRWIAALGNAIEASITGTASIRGSGSSSPSLSSLASVDDLGLRPYPSVSPSEQHPNGALGGLGLGFPSPSGSEREASAAGGGAFPGLRGWGNDLSRKVSLRGRAKHLSHQHSPSESGSASTFGGQQSILDPRAPVSAPGSSSGGRKRQHHRSQSVMPTSSAPAADGPRLNFISASPMGTPTQPLVNGHLLPPFEARSRLSFESSGSDRSSAGPSRSPSLLTDDIALHIDRFVTDLAAASSPDLTLSPVAGQSASSGRFFGGGGGSSSADRRTVSEGSEHPHHTPPPMPVLTIRSIAARLSNARCLDCERPNPRWATIGLNEAPVVGFMCIECSGVHRSLGSHVSKVRSVELDNWRESDIAVAAATGNAYINAIWEAIPPRPDDRANPQEFIPRKYIQELWRR